MLTIAQVKSDVQVVAVQELFREYTTWAFALAAGSDQAPTFQGLEEELATLPGIYIPPAGRLLLAMYGDEPAGCICLKGHDATTCELKRLYVRPKFRGLNIGWQLVNRLVEEARRSGYKRIVLDSHRSMKKAHALYEGVGFRRVSAPADFPEALKPVVVFMECDLSMTDVGQHGCVPHLPSKLCGAGKFG
jgi:GNAT superfamily N-acetyltransferase